MSKKKVALKYNIDQTRVFMINACHDGYLVDFKDFKSQFDSFAEQNPYFAKRQNTHYLMFHYYDPDFCTWVELPNNDFYHDTIWAKMCPIDSPIKDSHHANGNQQINPSGAAADCSALEGSEGVPGVIPLTEEEIHVLQIPSKKPEREKRRGCIYTAETFPTPPISSTAQKLIKDGRFKSRTKEFIKEVVPFLWELVGMPNEQTCAIYADSLILHFPDIASVDCGRFNLSTLLRDLIYTFSKNNYVPRLVGDQDLQRGSLESLIAAREAKSVKRTLELTEDNPSSNTGGPRIKRKKDDFQEINSFFDQDRLLKSKKSHVESVKVSLQNFKEERRSKINQHDTILDIINEWPLLGNSILIIAEFLAQQDSDHCTLQGKFNDMMSTLQEMFPISPSGSIEFDRITVLTMLEEQLRLPLGASYTRAVTVVQVANPIKKPKMPTTFKSNGPVILVYTSSSNQIKNAYLLAEGKKICSMEDPSTFDIYCLLVGSYYTFNLNYQKVTNDFYEFLDYAIFGTAPTSKTEKYKHMQAKFDALRNV